MSTNATKPFLQRRGPGIAEGRFHKQVIIDGRGHIMGRLAAIVAKQLLEGQDIVIIRAALIRISGSLQQNIVEFQSFLRKTCNTNPRRGTVHYRTPAKMFWRTVRGMLPHKTKRGAAALYRLSIHDGTPNNFKGLKSVVVPKALSVTRWRPQAKQCTLGQLAVRVGWKYSGVVRRLNKKTGALKSVTKRARRSIAKLHEIARRVAFPKLQAVNKKLNKLGHAYQDE